MAFVRTFTVTVSGGKYYIDSVQQPTINLAEGGLYKFDVSDSSNENHDLRFSTTSDGTHAGGTVYTTGVDNSGTPGDADAYLQIQVASGAPDPLYYFDTENSGLGGQANTVEAGTFGMRAWSTNQWGDQYAVDVPLTAPSGLTTTLGTASAYAETGWGSDTWGTENWGESGLTVPLTGVSATTAVGDPTVTYYPGWGTLDWGENGWGSVDEAKETLTGLSATAAVGAIAPADVMGLTGVSATGAVGSPVARSDNTTTLTGQAGTAAVGAIIVGEGVPLTGLSGTIALGTPVARGDYTESLTGLSATGAVGAPSITSNPTIQPTGVSATSAVGAISPTEQTMGLTGVSATAAAGAIAPTEQTMGLTGVSATVTLSPIGVAPIAWGKVTAAQTGNYSKTTATQTGNWARVSK